MKRKAEIGSQKLNKLRGFAGMDPAKRIELARQGGKSVRPENRSFARNRELARVSGAKGGRNVQANKRTFSRDPTLASTAGAKGGRAPRPTAQKDPLESVSATEVGGGLSTMERGGIAR